MDDETPLRDPAKKKALSYARDRRNSYGGNDKAARKAIPARKAGESRKSRRKAGHALKVIERGEETDAVLAESSLAHDVERVGGWRKGPDVPLGEVIERKQEKRVSSVGRKSGANPHSVQPGDLETASAFFDLLLNKEGLPPKKRKLEMRKALRAHRNADQKPD